MKYYSKKQWTQKLTVMVFLAMALGGTAVQAMPSGADIRSGQGSISQDGKNMTVQQNSQRMAIDWTKFDIAKDETVRYAQPDRNAISLNRVTGGQQSVIAGNLNANGNVVLVNPNGVVFTKNSSVDVGGLVASTARLNDEAMKNFSNGKDSLGLSLDKDSTASIINEGQIKAQGGLVALHAANVENKGTITNEGGTLAMAAAKNLTLSAADDDKLNFTVDGELAKSQALNSGSLKADGGYVVMTAKSAGDVLSTAVNNTGTIEAKTLRKNEKGQILLDGGDNGQIEVSGTLDASGMEDGQSAGSIKVIGQKTIVHDNTNLIARGNVDGGKIETSGDVLNLGNNLNIDAKGVNGKAGEWLLDPLAVYINDDDDDPTVGLASGTDKKVLDKSDITSDTKVLYNDPNKDGSNGANADSACVGITWIKGSFVNEMLTNGTDVKIQAASTNGAASIILNSEIFPTVGGSKKEATFTLEANRNIEVHKAIKANSDGGKLNVILNANTNNDGIGAVIIDADIETNGGYFISASGGKGEKGVRLESSGSNGFVTGNLTGEADHSAGTVGTHFGNTNTSGESGEKGDRKIITNGGAVTLNGEVSIGLNGGSLIIDTTTTQKDGKSDGEVTVTGIVNSGNAYILYTENSDKLNKLFESLAKITDEKDPLYKYTPQYYLSKGLVPAYHFEGVNYEREMGSDGKPKMVNGQYVYVKDKDGNYKYTKDAYTFGEGEKHYAFHELKPGDTASAGWTYTDTDSAINTQNVQWYVSSKAGTGYRAFIMTEGAMSFQQYLYFLQKSQKQFSTNYPKGTDPDKYTDAEKIAIIKELMINNWFVAEKLAQGETKGGAEVGDTYLATLTTRLENSLNAPDYQMPLYIGGRGSGIRDKNNDLKNNPYQNMPVDPTHQSGFYWVTGPEGQGDGTLFYDMRDSKFQASTVDGKKSDTKGKEVYGYTNWSSYENAKKTAIFWQPDNSSPFLTVGYGRTSLWDDAAIDGATTVGFIQEKNLANSSLKINSGRGEVKLQGDIGKSKALDTVSIESNNAVTVGTDNNNVTDYYHGTIYVDHGLYISGNGVKVGGEIHSGENPETDTSTTLEDKYKDNVTILSSGDIEVHGITSNTYDDGTTTTRGGKISLTSTGKTGKITLGAGVDYNGDATDGTLAAASAEKGAVVIDAQGSKGSLVNSTTGTSAITTGTGGTWQVYVNSPSDSDSDYGTSLGSNLNSGTNAQWTARSGSNTTVKTNSSNNTLSEYTDTSSNKFIFQVTPVITISGGSQQKTYGDILDEDQLRGLLSTSATYTDSTGKDVDVTQFSNFKEDDYLHYVTSSDGNKTGKDAVAVSSGGAAAGATRTNGDEDKKASDGNKAFYVFNVEEDGAKALNGYDLKTVNGDIEILRKNLTINTDATQTYGNADETSGKPSDYSAQLVNGDTLADSDIKYTISTNGDYAKSKGNNTTAHVRKDGYAGEYLTTGAVIKNGTDDVSANYEVSGSGTITVNKADLYLKVGDVSTTYGTAFDDTQYGYTVDDAKGGLVNGDTQSVLGDQFLNYTNTGAKTDASNDKVKTQNAGSYELQGAASKNLSDYTVHITNGKSTVEKAKLTLTVGNTETTYGTAFDPNTYSYTLAGNTNGDSEDNVRNNQIEVFYSNGGEMSDPNNSAVKTQNAGDYGLTGTFTLKGDTAKNYEIDEVNSDLIGKATVKKATVKVKLNDVSTTYGTAFDTSKYGYDTSSIEGLTNGDGSGVVTSALDGTYGTGNITYTNTGDASAEEKQAGKVTKTVNGGPYHLEGSTNQTLDNYNIEIENGNATIKKATLHLFTGDYTEAYGDAGAVQKDLDSATMVKGEKNGDSLVELTSKIGITNTSGALISKDRTNDVKYKTDGSLDSYGITTDFNKSLDNYDVVQDQAGSVTLTPVEVTVDNEMIQTYGSKDRSFKEVVDPGLVNGDRISTDGLKMAPKAGGKYETNKGNRTTADAGIYKDDLAFSGGGIVHADGTTDASKNYKVTIKGDIIVNKADLTVNTDDILTYYGVVKNTQSRVTGLTNGDQADGIQYGYGDYGHGYLNGNTTTNMPGNYAFGTSLSGPNFLKNYNIIGGNANLQIIQSKPDQTTHYVEGAHRPQDKIEAALPVFRVDASGVVKQYGTYGIESQSQAVTLSPTGMRMPEPNQTSTQDRKYLTTLKTAHGHGTFRLEYNGVVLRVIPVDPAAEQIVTDGDKMKNVALSEQALHAAYTQMGLDLVNLKGVYIYMAPM